jgi:putative inorganic carbon (HCO3(-)) transporter
MDAAVPLILVALHVAAALVLPSARARAVAMLLALAIAPVILVFHIEDSDQFRALTERPSLAAGAAAAGLAVVALLAVLIRRRPAALPVLAVAALPFRVPIAVGGTTANLLVPLAAVVAAGDRKSVV